ncbi:extracellular matrix protein 1 [Austrofundulus limnaeus]|uniref:Extracellular matrix protein 1 n=1 Tax=Austrofundulus limnaeus TaxID=52670 RepID=A0A2I4CYB5_AUSLI|nr:PREDICTED: extracellular matrix protein 1 [Austrofundulus limnaeus]
MGPSRAAVCAAVLLFVSLSSACTDEHDCLQREVSFDDIIREMQQPDADMEQKEVDLGDLMDLGEFSVTEQKRLLSPVDRGLGLTPVGRPPSFGPRSFGRLPVDYPVQFPLGRPTLDNIQAICVHGDHRPRYPDSYFPRSFFSKQKRKAAAVNNAESWFSTCCQLNQTLGVEGALCCATLAWERSVHLFCEEDLSVKDRLYECCKKRGNERLDCFNKDSSNPDYKPTEVLPVEQVQASAVFSFKPTDCSRDVSVTPVSQRANRGAVEKTQPTPNINFPPGRPSAENIDSLCGNQMLRPLYTTKCLPRSGNKLLARQVNTINRLEVGFKRCCQLKNGALNCADLKWRQEMNKYCLVRKGSQTFSQCCVDKKDDDRFRCFQSDSPDPHYNTTSAPEENTFSKVCRVRSRETRFPLKPVVKRCCLLPGGNQNSCLQQRLEEFSQNMCSRNKKGSPAVQRCCQLQTGEERTLQCLINIFMDPSSSSATRVQRQKKMCPIH